jgi:hypothetical protein
MNDKMNEQRNTSLTTADLASAGQAEAQEDDQIDSLKDEERTPGSSAATPPPEALITDGDVRQKRWEEIQTRFVDEPRESVEAADGLVAEVIQAAREQVRRRAFEARIAVASRYRGLDRRPAAGDAALPKLLPETPRGLIAVESSCINALR